MNENWVRWFRASIDKHFNSVVTTTDFPMYTEGNKRNTKDYPAFYELRIDGPRFTNLSHNYWMAYVEINVLIQAVLSDTDSHRLERLIGKVLVGFANRITIYRYGDGPSDDNSVFGCITLVQDESRRERIMVSKLGQIDPQTEIMQAIIEGHYKIQFDVVEEPEEYEGD
jgi:hypothetical protein